jgi:hypothetical protein
MPGLDPEPLFNSQHRNDSFGGAPAVRSSHAPSGRSAAIISTTVIFDAITKAQESDLVSCAPTQSIYPSIPPKTWTGLKSPWDRFPFPARERPCGPVRTQQRNAHRLASAFLDGLGARISVEVRPGKTRGDGIDLDTF